MIRMLLATIGGLILAFAACSREEAPNWNSLADGLELGQFELSQKSATGDSTIRILRVDPTHFELRVLCASELGHGSLTASEWRERYDLVAVTNAGMFDVDHSSHVGYLRNGDHVNQPKTHPDYSSVAAFDPGFRIFDTDEVDFETEIAPKFDVVIQNLRLIKRPGENRWSRQPKEWSEAALGEDANGNALFIFCRSPYSMHDLNLQLLDLPIDLVAAQHLEGGPEASLEIVIDDFSLSLMGSFETDFNENDANREFWPIPNVIGLARIDE
ncbi:MAG: phosphodiester glycosidase family protein [Verrucomicrobiota bacterium]